MIVSCSPDLIVYTDTDGDDKPDKREVLLTGFGGRDHDHGLHSFVQGPEGEWYGTVGNAGPHLVSDQRGWTLRSGSIYRGGGAEETDNHPRLESDDGRVYTGGLLLRVSPQGERLRVLAHNFRNNYEVALDSFGNLLQSDNDDDGNQACRTLWVMEGGNYGYFSADGSREWGADRRPGQSTTIAHWHQDDPGVMPTSCIDGAGGPTGMCVYEGGLLPKADVGLVLGCDAGRNCVYAHRPVRQGSGYTLEHGVFLKAREDPKDEHWRWFRPSDVCVGAEGALYVADWYDPGVGGHAAGDKEARGRILRIAPKGDRTRAPKIALDTPEHAAEALRSPAVSVRGQAVVALQKFGTRGANALDPLLASPEPRLAARALLALSGMGDGGIAKMLARRDDPNPELRLTVVHGWRHAYERLRVEEARMPPLLFAENEDPKEQDQAVLRELALCTRWNSDRTGRWRAFNGLDPRKLPPRWDGQDPWLLETLCDAYGGLPDLFYEQAGTLEQDPLRWTPRTAKLAWRLHFPACVPALLARAMASSLSPAERKQAVESLAFVREREGAEAMLTLALGGPADVRELARWWVEQRATNDWAAYGLQAQLQHGTAAPARDTVRERTLLATLARAGATGAECDAAASELCTTREGGLALLGLAAGGKLGEPGKQAAARAIGSCPDPSVRALAAQYFPPAAAKRPSSFEVLHLAGDAHAGAKIFFGDKTRCSSCHSFYGRGGDIGPDLSALSTKYGRKELLEAILDPNAAIANGYDTWLFETADGELIPGFLVSEGDPLVLRDTSGQKHVLAASELVSRTRQKVSAMPADVAAGLVAAGALRPGRVPGHQSAAARAQAGREAALRRREPLRLELLLRRPQGAPAGRLHARRGRRARLQGYADRLPAHRAGVHELRALAGVAPRARTAAGQLGRADAPPRPGQDLAGQHRGPAAAPQCGRHLEHRRLSDAGRRVAHGRAQDGQAGPHQREAGRGVEPLRDRPGRRGIAPGGQRRAAEQRQLVRGDSGPDLPAIRGCPDPVPERENHPHRALSSRGWIRGAPPGIEVRSGRRVARLPPYPRTTKDQTHEEDFPRLRARPVPARHELPRPQQVVQRRPRVELEGHRQQVGQRSDLLLRRLVGWQHRPLGRLRDLQLDRVLERQHRPGRQEVSA